MPIAAVPAYLQQQDPEFYLSAPPGHRFLLYFPVWGENGESSTLDWRSKDKVKKFKQNKGQLQFDGWTDIENDQFACTIAACQTPPYLETTPRARRPRIDPGLKPWKPLMEALAQRQAHLASACADVFTLDAIATAPFTTGLGNEHPLENGFAFLNPYGLPYLPGSGVKGVLRQAARELASDEWGDTKGWNAEKIHLLGRIELSMIDVLFGRETPDGDSDHVRGALSFWDAIPQIPGDSLAVDIVTPHQSHYYQQKKDRKSGDGTSPHDSGQPTPISFLTLPPGTRFAFHVQCDVAHLTRLASDLAADERWRILLAAAFEHAFEWLGFGAKTAVGYGAMESEAQRQRRQAEAKRQQAAETARQKAETQQRQQENAVAWEGARVKFNRSNGSLTVEKSGQSAIALAPKGEELLQTLPTDIQQKIKTGQFVKVTAHVAEGTLVRIEKA